MKKQILSIAAAAACLCATAEITPTERGARITVDSITTEVTIYSPSMVRVTKYVGTRPDTGAPTAAPASEMELKRVEAKGKHKIDTGEYYAAINEKDGNVSFWGHDGNLILAEQHRSASLTPHADSEGYAVRQDFQFGRSEADTITCPACKTDRPVNLKGRSAGFGNASQDLPVPYITTEKGYGILWMSPGPGRVDDTPGREVRKPGDVTFTSDSASAIDYFFVYPAPADIEIPE